MGAKYSCLDNEKSTWNYHCLLYDEETRNINLNVVDSYFPDDSVIQLAEASVNIGGLNYQHFFITDKKEVNFIELAGRSSTRERNCEPDYATIRVQCNTLPYEVYRICDMKIMTPTIKERMTQMLGMCNYSLCLRNSEHVANYIFYGKWASLQMEEDRVLINYFRKYMTPNQLKKINAFPSIIAPKNVADNSSPKLYSIIDKQYTPTGFQYFCNADSNSYNVLVVGPTGAGKSRLINVMFNAEICESIVSHQSVTKDLCFIEGNAEIVNLETSEKKERKIIVADTVGLCDTEWSDAKILELIRGRVSRNFENIHAVFIVFRADRLLKEHVKNITDMMSWLQYNKNYLNFLFVGTFAENLTIEDRERLKVEARTIFKLKDAKIPGSEYESLVYVGFPPEGYLNDEGKKQVKDSWELLQPLMRLNESCQPMKDYKKHIESAKAWYSFIPIKKISPSCTIL